MSLFQSSHFGDQLKGVTLKREAIIVHATTAN